MGMVDESDYPYCDYTITCDSCGKSQVNFTWRGIPPHPRHPEVLLSERAEFQGWQKSASDPSRCKWLCPTCNKAPGGAVFEVNQHMPMGPCPLCGNAGRQTRFDGRCVGCGQPVPEQLVLATVPVAVVFAECKVGDHNYLATVDYRVVAAKCEELAARGHQPGQDQTLAPGAYSCYRDQWPVADAINYILEWVDLRSQEPS